MDISVKTIGQLIDELITTDLRCWFAQEDIMNEALPTEKRLEGAINAQKQNAKRTELIRAIDIKLGEGNFSNVTKTYFKEEV